MKTLSFQQIKDCASLNELNADCAYIVDVDGAKWLLTKQFSTDEYTMSNDDKALIKMVALFAVQEQKISMSAIQRKFNIGYARACMIIDYMEDKGYISSANGVEPRKIFITQEQIDDIF